MNKKPKIIVVTGAESTGKSTLSKALSSHFNVPFTPEYARDYLHKLGRKYTYQDVEFIARKQIDQFNESQKANYPVIILDTWLINTKLRFEVVFKKVPYWMDNSLKFNKVDLFLVCDTDIPWIEDNIREYGGKMRLKFHDMCIEEIKKLQGRYEIINGEGDERIKKAINLIENL